MLNQSGIHTKSLTNPKQILFNSENKMTVGVQVDKTIASAVEVDGRKIIKAGTPLAGNLLNRGTAFTAPVAAAQGVTAKPAVGVLLHDVDVTTSNANGTLLIWGFVNMDRLDTATQALATAAATDLAGKVWFLKD